MRGDTTQVVEAGVDISATTLVTELAPWPSMIQRFGRCNRQGTDPKARVYWIKMDWKKKGAALPYTEDDLGESFSRLDDLEDASPSKLLSDLPDHDHKLVIRRSDIISLFDTTPDLAGMDIDISRYIRESEDHDIQVFWRDIVEGQSPQNSEPGPCRDELCPVPLGDIKNLKAVDLWQWDTIDKRWMSLRPPGLFPGMVLMMRQCDGCYNSEIGWTGRKADIPDLFATDAKVVPSYDDDQDTMTDWETLAEHTEVVVDKLKALLHDLNMQPGKWPELLTAARWHDAGKAHPVFRKAAVGDPPEPDPNIIWGKTARGYLNYERRGFRHELASALVMLEQGLPDLAAYLAAAHHGKVRLSIRSMPHEKMPDRADKRFARGIWDGDLMPEADLGGGTVMPEALLDLSYMEFGSGPRGPSWTARVTALRDQAQIGIFRLAFLEALLRVSDWRASMKSRQRNET